MASSTFTDIPPTLSERDSLNNTLLIIVNNDGTLSVDQETLHNLLAQQENTSTTAVRLIRLGVAPDDCSQKSSDSDEDGSTGSHVNITVEGYYPPHMAQAYQQNGGGDDVDEQLRNMGPEAMDRLVSAVKSDAGKQIFGEEAMTAMLDVISIDDDGVSELNDSIKQDHCYTNRSPSSDPSANVSPQLTLLTEPHGRTYSHSSPLQSKGVGRPRKESSAGRQGATPTTSGNLVMVQHMKMINVPATRIASPPVRSIASEKVSGTAPPRVSARLDSGKASGSLLRKNVMATGALRQSTVTATGLSLSITEEMLNEKMQEIQRSTDDYTNLSGDDFEDKSNSSGETSVDVEDFVPLSVMPTLPTNHKKQVGKNVVKGHYHKATNMFTNKTGKTMPTVKTPQRLHNLLKGESQKVGTTSVVRVYGKVKTNLNSDVKQSVPEVSTSPAAAVDNPALQALKKNYPKRENRKPPAHLLEVFNGPALFSVMDVPRRVSLDAKSELRKECDKTVGDFSHGNQISQGDDVSFETETTVDGDRFLTNQQTMDIRDQRAEDKAGLEELGASLGTEVYRRRSSTSTLDDESSITLGTKRRKSDERSAKIVDQSPRESIEFADSSDSYMDMDLTTEDDPNKLWCICKKPHNNRFMICCDSCEDWFHGKCVGVSKAMGKAMEERGNEWTCPNCKQQKSGEEADKHGKKQTKITTFLKMSSPVAVGAPSVSSPTAAEIGTHQSAMQASSSGVMFCIVCKKEARSNSIYCSDPCILKHAQNSGQTSKPVLLSKPETPVPTANQMKRVEPLILKKHPVTKVLTNMKKPVAIAPNPTVSGTLKTWLNVNPTIKVIRAGVPSTSSSSGTHLVLLKSPPIPGTKPKQAQLIAPKPMPPPVLKTPSRQTLLVVGTDPGQKAATSKDPSIVTNTIQAPNLSKGGASILKEKVVAAKSDGKRQSHIDSPKKEEKKQAGPEPIRLNVRKTLHELLLARIQDCDDLKTIPDDKVNKMALHIEEELYSFFKDTGMKYKSKYRSLIFNIKDPKNLTLFRKIAEKSVTPYQLVRLSPEELASQELAQWRERESKHQLEMIKKNELDLLALSKTYVMKTHKGEQVIETGDGVKSDVTPLENLDSIEADPNLDSVTSTVGDSSLEVLDKQKSKNKDSDKSKKSGKRSKSHKGSKARSKDRKKDSKSHSKSSHHSHGSDKHHKKSHDSDRKKSIDAGDIKIHTSVPEAKKVDNIGSEGIATKDFADDLSVDRVATPEIDESSIKEVIFGKKFVDSDADLEPTSTVTIKTPDFNATDDSGNETDSSITVWRGMAEMPEVAKFFTTIKIVSGESQNHCKSLPDKLDIVGRITPDLVWSHVSKMKKTGSYEIMVVRFTAATEDEKIPYVMLYSYLNTRNRLGVVGTKGVVGPVSSMIKDFYILPLSNHSPVPQVLLPLHGPGLDDDRPHLLLGILVARITVKRTAPASVFTAKVPRSIDTPDVSTARSYTPPLPDDDEPCVTPPLPSDESYASKLVHIEPREFTAQSKYDAELSAIKLRVTNLFDEDGDEPYSPGDTEPVISTDGLLSLPTSQIYLQRKMEELNRQIAEQKQEIENISSAIGGDATSALNAFDVKPLSCLLLDKTSSDQDENEAYSPSASLTPPPSDAFPFTASAVTATTPSVPSDISLPSNLQEILANISKKTKVPSKMDLKLDPIVQNYGAQHDDENEQTETERSIPVKAAVYIPSTIKSASEMSNAVPLSLESPKSLGTLSKLSDAELIQKAAAMEMELVAKPLTGVVKNTTLSLIKKAPVKYELPSTVPTLPGGLDIPLPPDTGMHPKPPGVEDSYTSRSYTSSIPPPVPNYPHPGYNIPLPPSTFPPSSPMPPPIPSALPSPPVSSDLIDSRYNDNKRKREGREDNAQQGDYGSSSSSSKKYNQQTRGPSSS